MRFSATLFGKRSLGVEIGPTGAAFALMGGSAAHPRLERVAFRPLEPGVLRASLREPNIHDTQAFCDCLRGAHGQLQHGGTTASVTLPDAVGRVLLMEVEERFKSRAEGLDIIRWKLKKSMPLDLSDTHLDYQKLREGENSGMVLLVSLASRSVIEQYEDLIAASGLLPARIDLNLFNVYRAFERRLALLDECTLISFYGSSLVIMIMVEGVPAFIRVKELTGVAPGDRRVYREISNSLLAYRERFPGRIPKGVTCVAPPEAVGEFRGLVGEAIADEALALDVASSVTPLSDAPADRVSLYPYTAAIGAALGRL